MFHKNVWFRPFFVLLIVLTAITGLTLNLSAQQSQTKAQPDKLADFSATQTAVSSPQAPTGLPSGTILETFPNSWHGSTIGLVYNPVSQTVRYAHEGQTSNPQTIWDIAATTPYTPLLGINLSTINGGWPVALNDRDGADYDPVANTYFLPDFNGDLSSRDDNLIEITPNGTILNAWELDGAGNDSSDGSTMSAVIDIALVPGASPRYFMTRAEGTGTVYEVSLTRAGLFVPATWSTLGSCSVPGGDNVGIDYDAEQDVLYHSSFSDEVVTVTDLSCNVLNQFVCDGPGASHTGITYIEGSNPPEVWLTDFSSNSTTRCAVPQLTLTKIASLGADCSNPVNTVSPGAQVTYCYTVSNISSYTFTTHSLVDDQLGTILDNATFPLAPGDTYSTSATTLLEQTTTNTAVWTASDGVISTITQASATVTVNIPTAFCNTYNSTDVPRTIPDNTTVTSTLPITGTISPIDVNVGLNIFHTWDADLILRLIGPNGENILLANARGSNGDNYIDTVFDSDAATPISAGSPPFTGAFRPEESLDILDGQNSVGTWTLQMTDTAAGDTGNLTAWYVELCRLPQTSITLTQTVGTTSGACATTNTITVAPGTDVYYCYEITNTGEYTLPLHTLTDSEFGSLLDGAYYSLAPGESVNTVELGIVASLNVTQPITATSTWYAEVPDFISAQANSSAVVHVNTAPSAVDDAYNTVEDTPLNVAAPGVLGNDTDDGVLTAVLDSPVTNGILSFNSDGSFIYTPTTNFNGTDTFSYIASDGTLTDTAVVTITVLSENDAPQVNAGLDQTADEGEVVNFSGSYIDPGLLAAGRVFAGGDAIHWDFGDGSTTTGVLTPTHIYGDNDVYTVTLTITDTEGAATSDALVVTINNVAPTVDAGSDMNGVVGTAVSFTGQFTDPGADTHTIEWDFGDGFTTTSTLTPTHTYTTTGTYTVTLTVTDDEGGSASDTLIVTITAEGFVLYLPAVIKP